MIATIRIAGQVDLDAPIKETLKRMGLKRKYSCVIFEENPLNIGRIKKVRDFVAYGKISHETFHKLIEIRGKLIDKTKKVDFKKIVSEVEAGKKLKDFNIIPVFRLHPPRKGIDSKKHFGVKKGILGDNGDKINELIERML